MRLIIAAIVLLAAALSLTPSKASESLAWSELVVVPDFACNPCTDDDCPTIIFAKCIDDIQLNQLLDCLKPGGPCAVLVKTDIWSYGPYGSHLAVRAVSPLELETMRNAVFSLESPAFQVLGLPDYCTMGLWMEGQLPPECRGPLKDILIKGGYVLPYN